MSPGKKSLARLERQALKAAKAAQKNIKQFATPEIDKLIKQAKNPQTNKQAKSIDLGSRYHLRMSWASDLEDRKGSWSWGVERDWGDELSESYIYPFLSDCQNSTWGQLESQKAGDRHRHISYDIEQIVPEAQARLIELELDDHDKIFRFRMTNKNRLYGVILNICVFNTVWFDPTHDICPSEKKNT